MTRRLASPLSPATCLPFSDRWACGGQAIRGLPVGGSSLPSERVQLGLWTDTLQRCGHQRALCSMVADPPGEAGPCSPRPSHIEARTPAPRSHTDLSVAARGCIFSAGAAHSALVAAGSTRPHSLSEDCPGPVFPVFSERYICHTRAHVPRRPSDLLLHPEMGRKKESLDSPLGGFVLLPLPLCRGLPVFTPQEGGHGDRVERRGRTGSKTEWTEGRLSREMARTGC